MLVAVVGVRTVEILGGIGAAAAFGNRVDDFWLS